jgi:hypothetical protein
LVLESADRVFVISRMLELQLSEALASARLEKMRVKGFILSSTP